MRRAFPLVVLAGCAVAAAAAVPTAQVLRETIKLQEAVLANQLSDLGRQQGRIEQAWARVQRLGTDLARAETQGEDLDNLRLRDEDLQAAEGELITALLQSQRLRGAMVATRSQIEQAKEELDKLGTGEREGGDPLSGTWRIVVEPGGQDGTLTLSLDGTLVTGTYSLAGGWSGSFRGTLVAEKVRLERIDSQIGFAAIFYGRLSIVGGSSRLEGTWEATQLATGLPASGTWVAERLEEAASE